MSAHVRVADDLNAQLRDRADEQDMSVTQLVDLFCRAGLAGALVDRVPDHGEPAPAQRHASLGRPRPRLPRL